MSRFQCFNFLTFFQYVAMPMVTSQILKFRDFTKTQKSRYLENKTSFFLQIEKFVNYTSTTTLWQKINK